MPGTEPISAGAIEKCAKIAEERAIKLREKAKAQRTTPTAGQWYFAQAIEARVIANHIRNLRTQTEMRTMLDEFSMETFESIQNDIKSKRIPLNKVRVVDRKIAGIHAEISANEITIHIQCDARKLSVENARSIAVTGRPSS